MSGQKAGQEVYDATSKGYSVGGFDLLSVLEAQRTVYATRLEIVTARAEFQRAKVEIEALTGRGLNEGQPCCSRLLLLLLLIAIIATLVSCSSQISASRPLHWRGRRLWAY